MAASSIQKSYDSLPSWAKGIVGVIIVGGVAVIGYTIYTKIRDRARLQDAMKVGDFAEQELMALAKKGIRPTLGKTQLESMSAKLEEAMNGCGTTTDQVYQVFKDLQNKADLLSLIMQFNVRYYRPCAVSSPISYAVWLRNERAYGGNIATWLTYDLSSAEITKINEILSAKGIDYKF